MADKKTGGSTVSKTEYIIEAGKHDLVMTHTFDAPRELVFKAYTDPKLFAEWWGPREYTNRMDKFDVRDRKSTRLNSSHQIISYAVFCLKKKKARRTRSTGSSRRYSMTYQEIGEKWASDVH